MAWVIGRVELLFLEMRKIMKGLKWGEETSHIQFGLRKIVFCHFKNLNFQSESESCSVMSDSLQQHRLHSPWSSLGQNTGVSSLLQG